jgi:methylated-DNA-[protein]-cysteine S-methyltransferase
MSSTLASIHLACTAQARFSSPLGPMLLARTAAGLAGAWFDGQQHHPGEFVAPSAPADLLLRDAAAQLRRFFAGELSRFTLPLDLLGTLFQRRVWQALLQIEFAGTRRYSDIAARIGEPAAARAVGAAVGRNPLSVIVPCHRVLGAGGALTGYAGGLERKVALLELERQCARPSERLDAAEAAA